MKIALVGFGKMGQRIKHILAEKNLEPVAIIDPYSAGVTSKTLDYKSLNGADVVIDFSSPAGVMDNIKFYNEVSVNVVMGTTGWYDRIEDVKRLIGNKTGFIWSGNFSLGVNIFFKIVEEAAAVLSGYKDYDVLMHEFHHKEKIDSPSGTALMIADLVKKSFKDREHVVTEMLDRKRDDSEIHLSSTRGGYIPGTHLVMFDSPCDTIELKHTARNRDGFAYGAVAAAQWIAGKKGFFSVNDMFSKI